jgi:predicted outer membrane lipoprotein
LFAVSQGCRGAPTLGLKLANAFGVSGLELANAFGVIITEPKLANAFGVLTSSSNCFEVAATE